MATAAALVIGNEILTGKVQEANVGFLGRELFALGIDLQRVVVIPDVPATIVEEVNALRTQFTHVFTSGGIGPTHDDLTIPSIAEAFGRKVVRSEEIERLLRSWHAKKGREVNEHDLRLADVIEGCRLVRGAAVPWPTIVIENVFILPGVPEIFRAKFASLTAMLNQGAPFVTRAVYTTAREGDIAELMHRITINHPKVVVGSYLAWNNPEYRTKVTFDCQNEDEADAAANEFSEALDDRVVRRE